MSVVLVNYNHTQSQSFVQCRVAYSNNTINDASHAVVNCLIADDFTCDFAVSNAIHNELSEVGWI